MAICSRCHDHVPAGYLETITFDDGHKERLCPLCRQDMEADLRRLTEDDEEERR